MKGIWESFESRNKATGRLENKFPGTFRVEIVDRQQVDTLIEKGEVQVKNEEKARKEKLGANYLLDGGPCGPYTWKYFYERFPNSNMYYRFSRIGFSRDRIFAVVEASGTGFGSSRDVLYMLIKTRTGWKQYGVGGGETVC